MDLIDNVNKRLAAFVAEDLTRQSRQFYFPHIFNERNLCGGEFETTMLQLTVRMATSV